MLLNLLFEKLERVKSGLLLKLKQIGLQDSRFLVVWSDSHSDSDVFGTILDFPCLIWKIMFSTNFYCIDMYQ